MKLLTTRALLCAATFVALAGCHDSNGAAAGETDTDGAAPQGDTDGDSADTDGPALADPGTCVETLTYFRNEVWAPFMSTQCFACHNPLGDARHTDLVLLSSDVPGYAEANLTAIRNVARLEIDDESLLLLKPLGAVEHAGGQQIEDGDARHEALKGLIAQLDDGSVTCADNADVGEFFKGVHMLDEGEILRRAAFGLASRLPTPEEVDAVRTGGSEALAETLRTLMTEDAFYTRVIEMFNQTLLTDKFLSGTLALDLLSTADFPTARWYDALPEGTERNTARSRSNVALAREPLELIRFIIANDRPFTDIVAANFTVANPYLARTYGLDMSPYADPTDQSDWRLVTVGELPHAGVLTSPAFLNRYPTTETNRNRMRAATTLDFFLATDVMSLGARPIASDSVAEHNPTMTNPECTSCHEIMDPVAGTFQNWDDLGRYRPTTWYQDMRAPGLGDLQTPTEAYASSLQWLGSTIATDPRFARAMVEMVYVGLTGQAAMSEPTDPSAANYASEIRAFGVQDSVFKGVAQTFIDSGFDFRELVVALVQTPYYRAFDADALDAERQEQLAGVGAVRLSSPEQFHRRIAAATGFTWLDDAGTTLLTRNRPLHLMYGGINSDSVVEPFEDPNGVMANIVDRMSNEMGCLATAQDFARPTADRLLFPHVNPQTIPGVDDDAILDNIVYLHERLLGETLDKDDPRVADTLALFTIVYEDGISGLAAAEYPANLIGPCQAMTDPLTGDPLAVTIVEDPDYTIRSWMAVVSAMLGDFRFMYE